MRVFLTQADLATEAGKQLLQLCLRITEDGKIDLEEIKALRQWLRVNQQHQSIAAVPYLHDIMNRITADGVIDKDELVELQLAIERVIPTAHRTPAVQARKKREANRRERLREQRRVEQEREKEERKRLREEEYARAMRIRHTFTKVAGVTFPNDDGTERQDILAQCKQGEQLYLQRDPNNQYSVFATKVLRMNGQQLGHVPEYLAERVVGELRDGYNVVGILTDVTGGTGYQSTLGANFAIFFVAKDVSIDDFNRYVNESLDGRV